MQLTLVQFNKMVATQVNRAAMNKVWEKKFIDGTTALDVVVVIVIG